MTPRTAGEPTSTRHWDGQTQAKPCMLYKHGHVPDRFSQPLGSLPSTNGRRLIADPEWHPHHLPLVCLGDPKAPRTDSTSGPMMGVPPGPAILQAAPGCTRMGSLPSANGPKTSWRTHVKRIGTAHSWSKARGTASVEHRAIQGIHNTLGATRRCIASVAILFLNMSLVVLQQATRTSKRVRNRSMRP